MAHVGVSVDDDTKEKWKQYVEQSDYGSLSELVRGAVRVEMRRESGGGGGIPREVEQQLTELVDTQTAVQEQVVELTEEFDGLGEELRDDQYPEQVIELAHEIAADMDEVHQSEFADLRLDAEMELAEIANERLGDESKAYLVAQAYEYLDENLSYIKPVPRQPSDYYRVRGR